MRILPLALLLAAWSCGPTFNYEGRWTGNRDIAVPKGEDKILYHSLGKVTLTIRNDTFEMTNSEVPIGGHIQWRSGAIDLTPEILMKVPLPGREKAKHPAIKATPQTDGSLKIEDPAAIDGRPVILRREENATPPNATPSSQ